MMKKLLIVITAAAALWAGYWVVGANALGAQYEAWLEERRAEGWQAEIAEQTVRGFPNRFDTTWTDISIVDPDTGLGWEGDFFQLFSLSYNPGHLIAIWPPEHRFLTPNGAINLANDQLRASLVLDGGTDLLLNRANLEANTLTITARDGDTTSLANLRAAVARVDGQEAQYKIAATTEGLALSAPLIQRLGKSLPDAFETARLDMIARFDRPWDINSIETRRPQPTQVTLTIAEAVWGPMQLRLTGAVDIAEDGTPEGDISLRAQDWQAMVDLAQASGALSTAMASGVSDALGLIARFSGKPDTIDVELTLAGGMILLGPLPIGPAPKIVLR